MVHFERVIVEQKEPTMQCKVNLKQLHQFLLVFCVFILIIHHYFCIIGSNFLKYNYYFLITLEGTCNYTDDLWAILLKKLFLLNPIPRHIFPVIDVTCCSFANHYSYGLLCSDFHKAEFQLWTSTSRAWSAGCWPSSTAWVSACWAWSPDCWGERPPRPRSGRPPTPRMLPPPSENDQKRW